MIIMIIVNIFEKVHQGSSSLAVWFISRKSTSAERLKVALSIRAMKEASL